MNKYIFTASSFGESVKEWSYEQFMDRFKPIFPDADLETLADELGIIKPVVAMFDKSKRSGSKNPLPSKTEDNDQNTAGGKKVGAGKRKGPRQGEHEADEERLY